MLITVPPRNKARGSARFFKLVGFILNTRFLAGCVVGVVLAWGYLSITTPHAVPCSQPVSVAVAPDPEPEPLTGETLLVAPEFAEVQYGPPRRSLPPKKLLVRFDTHRKCLQVKDQTSGVFIPDGCIVYGDTVRNKKRFDQQYARVGADEVRWKAEESAARYR